LHPRRRVAVRLPALVELDQIFDQRVTTTAARPRTARAPHLFHAVRAGLTGSQNLAVTDSTAVTDQHDDLVDRSVAS